MNTISKNKQKLKEFTEYCQKYPELRFFQALRNWIQENVDKKWNWLVVSDGKDEEDTFYWL